MPQIQGYQSKVFIWDTGGTCRDLSGDFNSVTMTWTRDNFDRTTFGFADIQRMAGLRDATLSGAGIWNSGATSADSVLTALMAASAQTLVRYAPASIAGCPVYVACMLINSYEVSGPIGGPTGISWAFQQSGGSMSASTV